MDKHLAGFNRYLHVLEGLSSKSSDIYSAKVKEFFAWMEGGDKAKPVSEITRQEIEGYLEWCFYQGNSNQTRQTKLTALGKFFRYLKYEKIITEDITAEIPKPKIFTRRMQTFTKEEVLSLFQAIDITREKGLRDVCIFILAAFLPVSGSARYTVSVWPI